jgi:thiol-disulfide isomerase/thioredoxin
LSARQNLGYTIKIRHSRGGFAAFGAALFLLSATAVPAITLKPINERSLKQEIARRRGKVVLVNLWSKSCPPCIASYPALVKLGRKYGPQGLSVISINVIDDEKTRAAWTIPFLKQKRPTFATFYENSKDQEAFIRSLDPKWYGSLPADFLYDAQGRRVVSFTKGVEQAKLEKAIQQQLARLPGPSRRASR